MEMKIHSEVGLQYNLDTQTGSYIYSSVSFREIQQLPIYLISYGHFIAGPAHFTQRNVPVEFCQIFLTLNGEGRFFIDGKEYLAGPDSIVLLNGSMLHRYESNNCMWIHEWLQFKGPYIPIYYKMICPNGFTVIDLKNRPHIIDIFFEIRDSIKSPDLLQQMHSSALLVQLLDEVYSLTVRKKRDQANEHYQNIRRAVSYIDEHYAEKITLDKLCSEAFLSKYYFCRTFKEYMGFTPHEYLNRIRIRKAQQLLLSSDLSIDEIAWKTGSKDSPNFVQLFKKITGTTPGQYRKNLGVF